MIFERPRADLGPLRTAIVDAYRADETAVVESLLEQAAFPDDAQARIAERARELVLEVRERRTGQGGIDSFLYAYELSSEEGVVLMCLAEALLRIPDVDTADRLIRDKITAAQWEKHLGQSPSLFVNASTWALMLTGRVIRLQDYEGQALTSVVGRLVAQLGEPVIRQAVTQAMRILGRQFVMGRTIEEAIERARPAEEMGYRHSYDMLGEAARTAEDAERYLHAYERAIEVIGRDPTGSDEIDRPGISVKLSALHPRFEYAQRDRALPALVDRLGALTRQAMDVGIGLTVDAEEADRLDLSLDIFEAVSGDDGLKGWGGLGLAVQAYQKRAVPVIDWLADVARRHRRRILVRLVKGAYWDTEIKRAQEQGLESYPVFTRKTATDVSYIACIKRLLATPAAFYPQFATHNALTLATVLEVAGARRDFEFQRLHGMGEALYDQVVGSERLGIACRGVCPHGQPRGSAALSGAPVAGKRRQYLLRQSHRGRQAASGGDHRRSHRQGPVARGEAPPPHPGAL